MYNYNPIGAWGDREKVRDEGSGAPFLTRNGAKIARQTHDADAIVLFMAWFLRTAPWISPRSHETGQGLEQPLTASIPSDVSEH